MATFLEQLISGGKELGVIVVGEVVADRAAERNAAAAAALTPQSTLAVNGNGSVDDEEDQATVTGVLGFLNTYAKPIGAITGLLTIGVLTKRYLSGRKS